MFDCLLCLCSDNLYCSAIVVATLNCLMRFFNVTDKVYCTVHLNAISIFVRLIGHAKNSSTTVCAEC